MMTSSNGTIFRVTDPLCGEFTGHGEVPTQRPVTRSFDIFFELRLNKRLSEQSWGWWFETPSCLLWRHRNVPAKTHTREVKTLTILAIKISDKLWISAVIENKCNISFDQAAILSSISDKVCSSRQSKLALLNYVDWLRKFRLYHEADVNVLRSTLCIECGIKVFALSISPDFPFGQGSDNTGLGLGGGMMAWHRSASSDTFDVTYHNGQLFFVIRKPKSTSKLRLRHPINHPETPKCLTFHLGKSPSSLCRDQCDITINYPNISCRPL